MWEVVWYVWGFKVYLVWVPLNMPLVLPLIPAVAKGILARYSAHGPDTEGLRAEWSFQILAGP